MAIVDYRNGLIEFNDAVTEGDAPAAHRVQEGMKATVDALSGADYIVAASDSRNKAASDYICDGTSDQVQIQAAIDAALAAGGGRVILRAGSYNTTAGIEMESNVYLVGEGDNATKLVPDFTVVDASNGPAILTNRTKYTVSNYIENIVVAGMLIDCTDLRTADASYVTHGKAIDIHFAKNASIEHVRALNTMSTAIAFDFVQNGWIRRCIVQGHGQLVAAVSDYGGNAFGIGTGATKYEKLVVTDCIAEGGGEGNNGFLFERQSGSEDGRGILLANCIARGSGGSGIRLASVKHAVVHNCQVYDSEQEGLAITGAPPFANGTPDNENIVIDGVTIRDAGSHGMIITGDQKSSLNEKEIANKQVAIRGCHVEWATSITGTDQWGIYIKSGDSKVAEGFELSNNTVVNSPDDSYRFEGNATHKVQNVTCHGNISRGSRDAHAVCAHVDGYRAFADVGWDCTGNGYTITSTSSDLIIDGYSFPDVGGTDISDGGATSITTREAGT